MRFKNYVKKLQEETTSADIATVTAKLDLTRRDASHMKHLSKGKKCKIHKRLNCEECTNEQYED